MHRATVIKQFLVVFGATSLALVVLLESGAVERLSYSLEKGRLSALRESLTSLDETSTAASTNRRVARLVMPAVVSIEADYTPAAIVAMNDQAETPRAKLRESHSDQAASAKPTPEVGDAVEESSSLPAARQGIGSGFIFDATRGHILTNAHVVDGARSVRVLLLDGRQTEAQVLGSDPASDLAVLRVDVSGLHDVPFGKSSTAAVGDDVLAVGNPFGLDGSVSKGIISAVNRRHIKVDGQLYAGALLQTDASISPGSSGGPLVNMRGEVIGINTAIITAAGTYDAVGFAIPSARAVDILDDLIDGGPGVLGVWAGSAVDPSWQQEVHQVGWDRAYGALITEIVPASGAERAGLKPTDIILALDDTRVENLQSLGAILSNYQAGMKVRVRLWRDKRVLTTPVNLGRRFAPR